MDILAHALWSGAIYNRRRVWWAVFFGVAPDLFSFGVFTVVQIVTRGLVRPEFIHGDVPRLASIPPYVFGLYQGTHSLVVWATLFLLAWLYFRRVPWEFTAWALHIIIDIPTHAAVFSRRRSSGPCRSRLSPTRSHGQRRGFLF